MWRWRQNRFSQLPSMYKKKLSFLHRSILYAAKFIPIQRPCEGFASINNAYYRYKVVRIYPRTPTKLRLQIFSSDTGKWWDSKWSLCGLVLLPAMGCCIGYLFSLFQKCLQNKIVSLLWIPRTWSWWHKPSLLKATM